MSLYLGIDTSNYTTSVAVCGDICQSERRIIDVKEGMRGIRQSDGVFVHTKTLPELFGNLQIDGRCITAVGVSTRPRSVDGSYMPVFLSGKGYAQVIAKTLGVPLYEFSHQDGHIMAGIISSGSLELLKKPFCCLHLSGGTCEILRAEYTGHGFETEIIGGTLDISLGQLIDRVGVKLGMKFPCGAALDSLALKSDKAIHLKTSVSDGYMNISGMETKLLSLCETEDKYTIAGSTFDFAARTICDALSKVNADDILFVGGVASSKFLRDYFSKNIKARLHFATPELSSDNAVGISHLCRMKSEVV